MFSPSSNCGHKSTPRNERKAHARACSIDLRVAPRLCERALGPETSGTVTTMTLAQETHLEGNPCDVLAQYMLHLLILFNRHPS
jgi:hypothetical protein